MCTEYYLEKIKDKKSKCYIDTSSLMHTEKLERFIDTKNKLISNGVSIIVIKPVYEELNKKLYSVSQSESEKARMGLYIIKENQDLFKICGLNERLDIDEVFADPVIHKTLIENQKEYVQLIITDDQNLAYDSNLLNERKSFSSNKVYACWIDYNGELVRSKGTYSEKRRRPTRERTQEDSSIKEMPESVEKTNNTTNNAKKIIIPTLIGTGGGLLGGYLLKKHDKEINLFLKIIIKKVCFAS